MKNTYPQMTYDEAIAHCKYWAEDIRHDGVDLLSTDYEAAIGVSDQLAYPLDMQRWISADKYPLLYEIRRYAARVDSHHTDRIAWDNLLKLIDKL